MPSPTSRRPPQTASRVASCLAISAGEKKRMFSAETPSRMRVVCPRAAPAGAGWPVSPMRPTPAPDPDEHLNHRPPSDVRSRRRLRERERRLPPRRLGADLDLIDPLDPPEAAPAGGDDPRWEAVARRQRATADPGGHQQPPALAEREATAVAVRRRDHQAPARGSLPVHRGTSLGSPGPRPTHRGTPWGCPGPLRQQPVQPGALPLLLGVPPAGAVDGGAQDRKSTRLNSSHLG